MFEAVNALLSWFDHYLLYMYMKILYLTPKYIQWYTIYISTDTINTLATASVSIK